MTNLIRWTPRRTAAVRTGRTLDQMMNDLWENVWNVRSANDSASPVLRPAMDVVENDDTITVRIDLPGLSPDDVNVEIEGDLLTISGEKGETVEQEGDRYYYRERSYGAFKRSLRLADTLDSENVAANFENGVLSLVLPKLPEAQPKRIKVETK